MMLKAPKKVLDAKDNVKRLAVGGDFAICWAEPTHLVQDSFLEEKDSF